MGIYERYGRLREQSEMQDEAYTALLNLTAGLVSGQIDPGRVMVNLSTRGWTLAPEGQRPSRPATVNGQPVCVTAPEPPIQAPPLDLPEAEKAV